MICEASTDRHFNNIIVSSAWCIRWRTNEGRMGVHKGDVLASGWFNSKGERWDTLLSCARILAQLSLISHIIFDTSINVNKSPSKGMLFANRKRIYHGGCAISLHILCCTKTDLQIHRAMETYCHITHTQQSTSLSKGRSRHYWWWWTSIDVPNNIESIHQTHKIANEECTIIL
jgi:hypothetical protein